MLCPGTLLSFLANFKAEPISLPECARDVSRWKRATPILNQGWRGSRAPQPGRLLPKTCFRLAAPAGGPKCGPLDCGVQKQVIPVDYIWISGISQNGSHFMALAAADFFQLCG